MWVLFSLATLIVIILVPIIYKNHFKYLQVPIKTIPLLLATKLGPSYTDTHHLQVKIVSFDQPWDSITVFNIIKCHLQQQSQLPNISYKNTTFILLTIQVQLQSRNKYDITFVQLCGHSFNVE